MSQSSQNPDRSVSQESDWSLKSLGFLALLTLLAFLVMGYHPGLEDDVFYLAAIKKHLNPALFPHDSDFFLLQVQATIYDKLIAFSVRLTHLPLVWVLLLWQVAGIFFVLHACWRVSRRCFSESESQWAAVSMIAVLLTLPVTGTGINLGDPYLHPRMLATAAILAAVVDAIDGQLWRAVVLLAIAFSIHAIMAIFGISLCVFLLLAQSQAKYQRPPAASIAAGILLPLGWLFEPASDAWRQAAATRGFYFLGRWEWYEWLGVFAPLVILYVYYRWHRSRATGPPSYLFPILCGLICYGVFQTIVGLVVMLPRSLERLRPFEPMRYLHLVYLFFFLIVGGLLGRYLFGRHMYRWLLFFVPLSAGMFYAQRRMYPASEHLELPGATSQNAWLQAFAWIRESTPIDALFALDPHYMTLPGEDYHGFPALAERSVLADYEKDGGMAARVPRLAPRWVKEVTALNGWQNFQSADFERLKREFGVSWVIVERADSSSSTRQDQSRGWTCPYQNQQVRVCRLY
jgi:hypothetical protein